MSVPSVASRRATVSSHWSTAGRVVVVVTVVDVTVVVEVGGPVVEVAGSTTTVPVIPRNSWTVQTYG